MNSTSDEDEASRKEKRILERKSRDELKEKKRKMGGDARAQAAVGGKQDRQAAKVRVMEREGEDEG